MRRITIVAQSSKISQDVAFVRNRLSEGLRACSYTVRRPQRVASYFHLLKQTCEKHLDVTIDKTAFENVLQQSDDKIDIYVDDLCKEMMQKLHNNKSDDTS